MNIKIQFIIFISLFLNISCQSFYDNMYETKRPQYLKKYQEDYNNARYDDQKLRYLLEIRNICNYKNKELKGCDMDIINKNIHELYMKYQKYTSIDNVIAITNTSLRENGLMSASMYGVNNGYSICGLLFNLSSNQIHAYKITAFLYDNFDKNIGNITWQSSLYTPINPYEYVMICSENSYKDISPETIGKTILAIENIR